MATQNTERPSRSAADQETEAFNWNIKADVALTDLDGLLVAALCVIRLEGNFTDTSEEDKKQALETLLEYGRGAVSDAQECHEKLWRLRYAFGSKRDAPDAVSDPEQPAPSATPTQTDQPT